MTPTARRLLIALSVLSGAAPCGLAAIGIALGTGDVEAYQCLVTDNLIKKTSGGSGTGILLEDDARACYVLDNKISGAAISDGLVIDDDSNDHVIAGNKCVGGDGTGIDVGGVGIILQGNRVKKSDLGIWIQSHCTDGLIIDNKVKASGSAGLTIDGDAANYVRNTVKGSGTFDLVNNTVPGQNAFVDNVFGTISP